jgi:hypothetical protein
MNISRYFVPNSSSIIDVSQIHMYLYMLAIIVAETLVEMSEIHLFCCWTQWIDIQWHVFWSQTICSGFIFCKYASNWYPIYIVLDYSTSIASIILSQRYLWTDLSIDESMPNYCRIQWFVLLNLTNLWWQATNFFELFNIFRTIIASYSIVDHCLCKILSCFCAWTSIDHNMEFMSINYFASFLSKDLNISWL